MCVYVCVCISNSNNIIIYSHNKLAELGDTLGYLVNLQYLRLDHNQLNHLHDNISSLSHLEQLVGFKTFIT